MNRVQVWRMAPSEQFDRHTLAATWQQQLRVLKTKYPLLLYTNCLSSTPNSTIRYPGHVYGPPAKWLFGGTKEFPQSLVGYRMFPDTTTRVSGMRG